jgi:hypothetical protein
LIRMPLDAAMPEPTITAVGAANPTAQGHAITSTLIPAKHDSNDAGHYTDFRVQCSAAGVQGIARC